MGFDINTGVNAAKTSFIRTGLPLMVGAFIVAVIMAVVAGRNE